MEDACLVTARCLWLSPLVIIHGVIDMLWEGFFVTLDYKPMMAGASDLLFVAPASAPSEKLQAKAHLWENMLQVNMLLSIVESSQLLAIDNGPQQVYWVTTESSSKGFSELFITMWSDTHPLVEDLISAVVQNIKKRRIQVDL